VLKIFLPTPILVEVLERCIQMLFPVHLVHVDRSCNELGVIDGAIAINISLPSIVSSEHTRKENID
jgi:hypothetical protein